MIVVSDTSPISNLLVIGQLDLLRVLFGKIIMPERVLHELARLHDFGYDISEITSANWISVLPVGDAQAVFELSKQLDPGESEAIVLAQELKADFLLIDERRGWKIANSLKIKTVGVLGVLLKAKAEGHISTISPLLVDLETKAGFWLGDALKKEVLARAGE